MGGGVRQPMDVHYTVNDGRKHYIILKSNDAKNHPGAAQADVSTAND